MGVAEVVLMPAIKELGRLRQVDCGGRKATLALQSKTLSHNTKTMLEMARWLRACIILAEDLSQAAHNHL